MWECFGEAWGSLGRLGEGPRSGVGEASDRKLGIYEEKHWKVQAKLPLEAMETLSMKLRVELQNKQSGHTTEQSRLDSGLLLMCVSEVVACGAKLSKTYISAFAEHAQRVNMCEYSLY